MSSGLGWQPQDEKELRRAVLRGQGRALIYLQRVGGDAHFETIESLCQECIALEPQMDDHTDYLLEIVQTLSRPDRLVPGLVKVLFASGYDHHDRYQHRVLLARMAELGNVAARDALIRDFHRFRLRDRPHEYGVDLLGLEGLNLMLRNAKRLDDYECRHAYETAVEKFGKRAVGKVMAQFRGPKTKGRFVRPWSPPRDSTEIEPSTDEMLEQLVEKGGKLRYKFARQANNDQLVRLAESVLVTEDIEVLRAGVTVFGRRPWPLDVDAVLEQAEKDSRKLDWLRLMLLNDVRSPRLRGWAMAHMDDPWVFQAFDYLERNAKRADLPAMLDAMKQWRGNRNAHHNLCLPVLQLACKPSVEMLEEIFEWTACEYCRLNAAGKLAKKGLLTESQRYELEFDAYHLARRYARKRKRSLDARSRLLESRA